MRCTIPGGTWFFTVNLAVRSNNRLLVEQIDALRQAFRATRRDHPFWTQAMVVLPEHLHAIWTLPDGDADFSVRWTLIKARFSRAIEPASRVHPAACVAGSGECGSAGFMNM